MLYSYKIEMQQLVSLMRFNIMMLLTFYYIKIASEHIFAKEGQVRLKMIMVGIYAVFMIIMISACVGLAIDLDERNIREDQLCISSYNLMFKWSEIFCSIILLIITAFV